MEVLRSEEKGSYRNQKIAEKANRAADKAKEIMVERGAPENICLAAEAVSIGVVCGKANSHDL